MVVLAIVAVLMGIGAPYFGQILNNFRQSSTMSQLVSDLAQARNESIKRNSRVLLCARNAAGTDCDPAANWQNGWLVCADADSDGACDPGNNTDGSPNLISVRPVVSTQLTWSAAPAAAIVFNASGTQGVAGAAAVTLTLTGAWSGVVPKTVSISATGKITQQ